MNLILLIDLINQLQMLKTRICYDNAIIALNFDGKYD